MPPYSSKQRGGPGSGPGSGSGSGGGAGRSCGTTRGCTLDIEHLNNLSAIEKRSGTIREIESKMRRIEERMKDVQDRGTPGSLSDAEYHELRTLTHDLRMLQTEHVNLSKSGTVLDYYSKVGDILFQYYDLMDKGAPPQTRAPATGGSKPPSNSILNYFLAPDGGGGAQQSNAANAPTDCTEDRAALFDKYAMRIGARVNNGAVEQVCRHCGDPDQNLQPQEGTLSCNKCFTVEYVLIDHDKPSFKDPPKETAFAYKRINHLNEWLNQVQGKETTDIPEEVYDSILLEIKKRKITNMADLNVKRMKDILKKLSLNRYYEHGPHIINRLNGVPMPTLPAELEERIRQMFCQIQVPFLKHMPNQRKNFLSYSYCLNKMMQLLEEDQYLSSFPLLKSREKLHQQDMIWRNICNDLGWEFIPSL